MTENILIVSSNFFFKQLLDKVFSNSYQIFIYIYIFIYIQEELKEEDPNRFRKKINQLENKHANFRKVLEKRSKKWQKFKTTTKSRIQNNITLTEKVTKNNDSIKISSNQSGNYANNGQHILTSREGSSNINLNESLISGSSSNVTVREEEKSPEWH